MTKREVYTAIVEGKVTDEVINEVKKYIETLDKTNAKRKEAKTKAQAETDEKVLAVLTTEGAKAKAIGEATGFTTSKVVASCKRLAEEGKCVITENRDGSRIVNTYALVENEEEAE